MDRRAGLIADARAAVAEGSDAVKAEVEAVAELVEAAEDEHDASRQQNWLRLIAALPWGPPPPTLLNLSAASAQKALDAAHGGHAHVKAILADRVAASAHLGRHGDGEHRLKPLLLVGPPGTGKTTLARAMAAALGVPCEMVSVPMAAMDECYLQGADRIWSNAEPGAIVRAVRRTGSAQLLLVLDEMEKAGGSSWRGTSATAWLLDLLGSTTWSDRYVGVPYPTSRMSFVATANELTPIPAPLLDRCEVVEVPGLSLADRLEVSQLHCGPACCRPMAYLPERCPSRRTRWSWWSPAMPVPMRLGSVEWRPGWRLCSTERLLRVRPLDGYGSPQSLWQTAWAHVPMPGGL